jgi:hypothetical protein
MKNAYEQNMFLSCKGRAKNKYNSYRSCHCLLDQTLENAAIFAASSTTGMRLSNIHCFICSMDRHMFSANRASIKRGD